MNEIRRNHRGFRVGADHQRARHSDATVARARQYREQGMTYTRIAELTGANWRTVADWCQYATRWSA